MTQEEIERLTVLLHDGYPCGQIGCRETGETFAALVAEVRRLRGVVEAAKAYLDEWDSDGFECVAHVALIDALRAFVSEEGTNA